MSIDLLIFGSNGLIVDDDGLIRLARLWIDASGG